MKNKKTTINETISYTRRMTKGLSNAQRNETLAEAIHPYVYRRVKSVCDYNPDAIKYIRENFGTVSNVSRYVAQEINENNASINEGIGTAIGKVAGSALTKWLLGGAGFIGGRWLGEKFKKWCNKGSSTTPDDFLKNLDSGTVADLAQVFGSCVPDGFDTTKWQKACATTAQKTQLKSGEGFAKSLLMEIIEAYRNDETADSGNDTNGGDDATVAPVSATGDDGNQDADNDTQAQQEQGDDAPEVTGDESSVAQFYKTCVVMIKKNQGSQLVEYIKSNIKDCFLCARDYKWVFKEGQGFKSLNAEEDASNVLTDGKGAYQRSVNDGLENIDKTNYEA